MDILLNKFRILPIKALIRSFISKTKTLQLILIVMFALIVNVNTLFNDFVYDDSHQIVNNIWVTNIKYIPQIFSHDATHAETLSISNYYRPMMNVIYMVNYYIFNGLKPWGFHLVNIIFHIGVTILVFLITSLLIFDERAAPSSFFLSIPFVSALIFAVHPIHTEVVAWVACIPELSFTFFCLLSMNYYIKCLNNFNRDYILSLVFFGIAIFCKETTVTLLPILGIYDYIYRTEKFDFRRCTLRFAPFVLVVGIYLILRFNALGGMAPSNRHSELNTFEVIINVFPLFSQYLEKLILPINLNAFYVLHPVHSITEPKWIFSFFIVTAIISLSYILFKKNKTSFFGLILITIPLLPVLYIRGLGENTFADRYLYLPSIGFALVLSSFLIIKGINSDRWRMQISLLLVFILIVYSIGTINRNKVWHDDLSLWSDTIKKSPDNYMVHNYMSVALGSKGDFDASIKESEKALALNPYFAESYYDLGVTLCNKGDLDAAIKEYQEALALDPNYFEAHNSMAVALNNKGDLDASIKESKKALTINPNFSDAHKNLGLALRNKGVLDAAINEFQKAIEIEPNSFEAFNAMAVALAYKGDFNDSIKESKKSLMINPNYAEAHYNLGITLGNNGDLDAAIKEYQEAININPNYKDALNNLGIALAKKKIQSTSRK